MNKLKCLIFIVLIVSMSIPEVYAFQKKTHKAVTEYVAENSVNEYSFDLFIKNYLGYKEGIEELLFDKKCYEWVGLGGYSEDIFARYLNHFHDPLAADWPNAGLTGPFYSIIYALHTPNRDGGHFSWEEVRALYYKSLTYNSTEDAFIHRRSYFADTLRGVGHLMHLIEDAGCPLHSRNDAHFLGTTFEKYCEDKINDYGEKDKRDIEISNLLVSYPFTLDQNLLQYSNNQAQLVIDNLVDTDIYVGVNLEDTASGLIGLSEYSNANFLSIGTFPGTFLDGNYPNPDILTNPDKDEEMVSVLDNEFARAYYYHTIGGDRYKVGAVSLATFLFGSTTTSPILDDGIYKNYYNRLIPRVIKYAGGLLEYFFRGTIDILPPDDGVYGLIDGSDNPQQFTTLKCKLKNTTENDEMNEGDLIAVAKYKKRLDYQPDLSADPPSSASREDEFSISVSSPYHITSLSNSTAEAFEFDFSSSPIPAGITDLYLQVVFKGNLGNETGENGEPGNAIAVGMKDLYEPAHITILNSTDMFYLNGGVWTSQEIRNDPDLLDLVDFDDDGIVNELLEPYIDPYDNEIWLTFYHADASAPTEHHVYWNAIPPGRIGRLILLTDSSPLFVDMERKPSYKDVIWSNTYTMETGIVNQDDGNDNFQTTNVFSFRGNITYDGTALFSDGETTGIMSAPWPDITETEPIPATDLNTSPTYQ